MKDPENTDQSEQKKEDSQKDGTIKAAKTGDVAELNLRVLLLGYIDFYIQIV